MKSQTLIFAGLTLTVVAGLFALTVTRKPSSHPNAAADVFDQRVQSPKWELKGIDGKAVKSSDFAGKVVLLDFWATWCGPYAAWRFQVS